MGLSLEWSHGPSGIQILYLGGGAKCVKNVSKCVFFTPPRGALIIRQIGWFCTPPGYLARASRILVYTRQNPRFTIEISRPQKPHFAPVAPGKTTPGNWKSIDFSRKGLARPRYPAFFGSYTRRSTRLMRKRARRSFALARDRTRGSPGPPKNALPAPPKTPFLTPPHPQNAHFGTPPRFHPILGTPPKTPLMSEQN